jgi:8-oxo-dGTP pyrophosphatase MutT (NUDIX family)
VATSDVPIEAAVLVPIFLRAGEWQVVYIERGADVPVHQGQMAFPGGVRRAREETKLETALREAEEEIGLRRSDVTILRELPETRTMTSNYVIAPFVGRIPEEYPFRPDPREIGRIVTWSASALRDPAARRVIPRTLHDGTEATVPAIVLGGDVIWGATERITIELLRTL